MTRAPRPSSSRPSSSRTRRLLSTAALAAALATGAAGCGLVGGGVYDTPLPGGADVGSNPITLTADFDDVLDLVPQSSVKVDNVAVGRVADIDLNDGGHSARVTLTVNAATELPAGTVARLQQTSLLGEKYVALVRPDEPEAGADLASGDHIALAATSEAAEVEEVLGALSMVLNGGGIGQFQEISRELQEVSEGRPEEIKAFLSTAETFVAGLDDRKESITAALDSLARLSTTLEADTGKIVNALDGLEPGMQVIVDQREQLVDMLEALDRLSGVTVRTLDAAQDDIVADFKALQPILDQLAQAGQDLPNSLEILLTYPFPDSVLGAIKGDYLNVFVETNFRSLPSGCEAIGCMWAQPEGPGWPASGGSTQDPSTQSRPSDGGDDSDDPGPVPTFLPPTSSATPGMPAPTIPVPTERPGQSPGPSSSATPSTPPANQPGGSGGASSGGTSGDGASGDGGGDD